LWKIKHSFFETQAQNLCFEKKEKMVDHLQNLEMGMKNLFQNDQGTTSHVLELIVERIMQVGKFSLASSQPF
jgi:hypothetical protein